MSYIANQYNYATPLSSAADMVRQSAYGVDKRYFSLASNKLDGSYVPISGDVGLWGTSVSDATGALQEPFVVTVTESLRIATFSLSGSMYCYPVAFTVQFYNGDYVVYSIAETENSSYEYHKVLPEPLSVTSYVISITKISEANETAKLFSVYRALQISGVDSASVATVETSRVVDIGIYVTSSDTLRVAAAESRSHVLSTTKSADNASVAVDGASVPTNIHTVMKAPQRRVYGKVQITYTDPLLDDTVTLSSSGEAHNSEQGQLLDGVARPDGRFFSLFDNDLSGDYSPSDASKQVGWTSKTVSDADGYFVDTPYVLLNFSPRPLASLTMHLDDSHGCLIEDFTVVFTKADGSTETKTFTGNTLTAVPLVDTPIADVIAVKVAVNKVSKPFYPATILDLPATSTFLYVGYQDKSDLISIDVLEELTYEDDVEALGGVSANEVTVVLDNSNREFNITNDKSLIAKQLKRNRKIVPWLGAEVIPGEIEWHRLGTYWSYSWDVPYGSLTASVVGFDTIGLLDQTDYIEHGVLVGKSLGFLIDYVLSDAKRQLNFLEWSVADELYNVTVPYAWFEHGSHAAALRRISQSYPMHIYCNRQGRIVAAPQKLRLDYYHDVWSDSTNVVDKTYSSLYTVLPNIINVTVINPAVVAGEQLASDELVFNVSNVPDRTLNFSSPYVDNLVVTVDKDPSVSYTYEVRSWGIELHFTGVGLVRSITCVGDALDVSKTSLYTRRDNDSVRVNGAVTRDISASFIQTSDIAVYLANRLVDLATYDIYDAEVNYRGDIALTIGDPILLLDGIAPDSRYNIKRHQLTWDGGLTGVATLNT